MIYEWDQAKPLETSNTIFEWDQGQPFIAMLGLSLPYFLQLAVGYLERDMGASAKLEITSDPVAYLEKDLDMEGTLK